MQETELNKFRKVVSEVSSFVGNPVSISRVTASCIILANIWITRTAGTLAIYKLENPALLRILI